MIASGFHVRPADWDTDLQDLRAVREEVFVEEQNVPVDLEWDELDESSRHVLAYSDEGEAIGTGRLTPEAKIGRMAVLKSWRGKGVGAAILQALVEQAQERRLVQVSLHAQSHARDFYARAGFEPYGEEFMEAGIPHVRMKRELAKAPSLERPEPPREPSESINQIETLANVYEDLVAQTRRRLDLVTFDLDPAITQREDFLDAFRALATGGRGVKIRVLLYAPRVAIERSPRLLEIITQLSSICQVRVMDAEDQERQRWFVLSDQRRCLYRETYNDTVTRHFPRDAARVSQLSGQFNRMWNRAAQDPNLRRLGI